MYQNKDGEGNRDKSHKRTQQVLEMQLVLHELGRKESRRHSGKEQLLWKAVEPEKLKFGLGDGEKNQFTWRRWFGEESKDKRILI